MGRRNLSRRTTSAEKSSMSKALLNLPSSFIAVGTKSDSGEVSARACSDLAGNILFPVWSSHLLAKQAQPKSAKALAEFPITALLSAVTPTGNQRLYFYFDASASEMAFDSDNFQIAQLESRKLILLPQDLESAISIYGTLMARGGDRLDPEMVRQIKIAAASHPGLKLLPLMQLCLEEQSIKLSKIEGKVERAKQLRNPVWRGKMQCTDCDYEWMSNKTTPPAQCPKCRSKLINPVSEEGGSSGCFASVLLIVLAFGLAAATVLAR
jgi:predicted Zn-ribbon and HTH transcriptional regulator